MKTFRWSTLAAVGLAAGLLFLPSLFPPARAAIIGNSEPIAAVIASSHFEEPLVAVGPTSPAEDESLKQALKAYGRRSQPGDRGSLEVFLSQNPRSGWAPALWTNLGLSYLHDGFFSRAIEAWQKAWLTGKSATDPRAKALIDRAIGELAQLYANLGHNEQLAALFEEVGQRPITGSATEAFQNAREELDLTEKDPRHLFICGPLALKQLMLARNVSPEKVDFLQWYRAGSTGTSLAEVGRLADKAELGHLLILREPGQAVPVPSIVHWKVGHFAAIVGQANGRYHVRDSVFSGSDLWVTQAALDAEASGYFLVPTDVLPDPHWKPVDAEKASVIWGKGPTNGTRPGGPNDPPANPPPDYPAPPAPPPANPPLPRAGPPLTPPNPNCPLCGYNIKEASVAVSLSDTPVGYAPPIGPSAKVEISYNQREDSQPAVFSFFNVSPKWTISWLSYVTDDPTNPGANVSRYMRGGGAFYYLGYDANAGTFAAQDDDGSILVRASGSPITYRRQLADGSTEIYAQSDGATAYPRRIFLSQIIDPQGNALTLTYDGQQRLISLTDAVGRLTTFTYGLAGRPFLVTKITDPFGRSATLAYDANGRLSSITDIIGLTSSFTYDANSLVNSLATPYGTTTFAYTAPGTSSPPRFVEVTDPLGYHEREEWLEPSVIPNTDPANTVPQGMAVVNNYLTYRNSFHWDKDAYLAAGCTPTGGCDYTKARIRHFVHMPNSSIKGTAIESVKYPLENRIWYNYPGQVNSIYGGTFDRPTAIGRVLDDGTTQLSKFSYDTNGFFNLTQAIDPTGRTTSYAYANQVDLAAVSQTTQAGIQTTIAQYVYNNRHRPLFYTDAAGQMWRYTYNAAGQVTSSVDPLGHTTTYHYDSSANLTSITNANNATAATYTYDGFDRVRTYTDSEGWTATYDYDAADRLTKIIYPDGTTDLYTYNKLDPASYTDRLNRLWSYQYDANRRLTNVTDPLNGQTLLGYDGMGHLSSLTDPKTNITTWTYDIQGRLKQKTYADSSTVTYTYENTTSRLKSVLDALGQTKQFSYAKDDRLTGIAYLNAVHATPNVSFVYDTYFPRLASMTDGTGTTQYSYFPPFAQGALQLQQESGPLPSATITYGYDELGRPTSRTVSGAGAETFAYDAIDRLTGHTSDLGAFVIGYLGQTEQITSRQLTGSTLSTTWSYLPNSGDRRLAGISNVGLSAAQYSTFLYTTTPENQISSVTETSDATTVYPAALTQTAAYNNLNQLTNLSGQALSFDANGNLLSDGQRTYGWDAENRLVTISYPGQPGKATTFAYDGLGRRTAITSTPTSGSAVTTSYIWCGSRPCQARNAANAATRGYYDEGEFALGSPSQAYYYAPDQIGSVRRVFATNSNAPSYSYDPYGNSLQGTAALTDFGYADLFINPDSGLYLTKYRAYDPVVGRWLSRDPLGGPSLQLAPIQFENEEVNLIRATSANPYRYVGTVEAGVSMSYFTEYQTWLNEVNLYSYVHNSPVNIIDPSGEGSLGNFIRACGIIAGLSGPPTDNGPATAAGNQSGPYQMPPPVVEILPSGPGPKRR
ncbi:peptidase C39 [Mesorhizobium sp. M1C.F.Ca.ET.193.01.1.1]|uniref:RHS repeat-associated core domain-containing protein n=3 Tax=Mesorhizobium TaxID=68287 RepID=UPI000FD41C5B|nr:MULTISPECIES: RHS repeat-associated core domain-containing protein [unclassified Mesorhizobium]TGS93964.1 peptidase C39 [bacterium M00.F.Ca.ET.177.01.1.1]TGQ51032.1 peptidase C39 [Mesorhizobium sp. M1C.F.Ca.ET.210.01.1.1]TGQ66463.1 peptidase C39 [Mesorhizobium sp. M1C.F.Ca.ET.212.01.1.1]TGR00859.1 peptidase C39 [Mesorhizobium sp. M1C.F.Ca.ET.204.01.1.1]TGR21134.1 peptidase C39 [Mesorhizobium sp. M1C.F.Ca.ET.196.01.1.1]